MRTQHEFCFFACAIPKSALTPKYPRKRGQLTIEHLALRTQPITLRHQVINLLASLQHALNGLVQHNLRLVQLLLDLHDAVGLVRVLVLHNVFLELGEGERGAGVGPGRAWVLGQELVDDFREQLVGDQCWVCVVRDDDAGDALGAAVGVECVVCRLSDEQRLYRRAQLHTLLLDILSLTGFCSFRHRLAEHGHELAIAAHMGSAQAWQTALISCIV